jgi:hypothetical protein
MNALWRRAPLALAHHPAILACVAVGALLVALAAGLGPLFTTASGSTALKSKLAEITPLSAGIEIAQATELTDFSTGPGSAGGLARRERNFRHAFGAIPFLGDQIVTQLTGPLQVEAVGTAAAQTGTVRVRLMSRTGVLGHTRRLAGAEGPGIWIADSVATQLGLHPGDQLRLMSQRGLQPRTAKVRVDAVYQALWTQQESPYWINFTHDIYPQNLDATPPPAFAFADERQLIALYQRLGGGDIEYRWEFPVDERGITLPDARGLERRFAAIQRDLRQPRSALGRSLGCEPAAADGLACYFSSSLSAAVTLADQNIDAVSPPVTLLAIVGTIVAIGIVASAGLFLVARRRGEARLLFARGEPASSYMARTALEAALPTLLGGVAGFGLAVGLVRLFEPNGSLDSATFVDGVTASATRVAAGLAVMAAFAGFGFLSQFESGMGHARWLTRVPWELAVGGLAAYFWIRLHGGGLVEGSGGQIPHPSLAAYVFPLLLAGSVASIVARLFRAALRRIGSRGTSVPGLYLAVRRLRAARGLVAALLVGCAVALGAFFYARALVASLDHGLAVKALVANGSDAQGRIRYSDRLPTRFPFPLTKVSIDYSGAAVGSEIGPEVGLMAIDPTTLPLATEWDPSFGPPPETLARSLSPSGTKLPVIVAGGSISGSSLSILGATIPIDVVASVRAFPGLTGHRPLVITSYAALDRAADRAGIAEPLDAPSASTLVWAKGPPQAAARALQDSKLRPYYIQTIEEFLHDPDIAAETRTFSFLGALGIGAGLFTVIGVLLYLQARQRREVISAALLQRMGLRARTRIFALEIELGAVFLLALVVAAGTSLVAANAVISKIDPLEQFPPAPEFRSPWSLIGIAAGALVAVAVAGAVVASRSAARANVAEAMRLGT